MRDDRWNDRYPPRFRRLWMHARFEITELGRMVLEAEDKRDKLDITARLRERDADDEPA